MQVVYIESNDDRTFWVMTESTRANQYWSKAKGFADNPTRNAEIRARLQTANISWEIWYSPALDRFFQIWLYICSCLANAFKIYSVRYRVILLFGYKGSTATWSMFRWTLWVNQRILLPSHLLPRPSIMPPPPPYERRMDALGGDGPAKKRRKGATRLSCAECRRYVICTLSSLITFLLISICRLKLRCDRAIPCSSCVKRGCGPICPDVGTRLIPFGSHLTILLSGLPYDWPRKSVQSTVIFSLWRQAYNYPTDLSLLRHKNCMRKFLNWQRAFENWRMHWGARILIWRRSSIHC